MRASVARTAAPAPSSSPARPTQTSPTQPGRAARKAPGPPDRSRSLAEGRPGAPAATGRGRSEERRIFLCNLKGCLLYSNNVERAEPGADASHPRWADEERHLNSHIQQLCARLKTATLSGSDCGRAQDRSTGEVRSIQVGPCTFRLRALLLNPATGGEPMVLILVDRVGGAKPVQLDLAHLQGAYNLTNRELEVLEWVRKGASYKEMAQGLGISPHTIRDHILKMKLKFQADSKCGIMARLIEESCHL